MATQKQNTSLPIWCIAALLILSVAVVGLIAVLALKPVTIVSSFEQCKQAGGSVAESSPEQCTIQGTTFVDTTQTTNTGNEAYVGMTEKEALAAAEKAQTPARVVERDGESQATDSSFVPGRLSFYVKDGSVYKVTVEAQLQDQ